MRWEVISAYAAYLTPFMPASHNDWKHFIKDVEIDCYVTLLDQLSSYLQRVTANARAGAQLRDAAP